jgi:PLP dependent protein
MGEPRADEIRLRLAEIRGRIDEACRKAGRASSEVTLVAVTKTFPASDVRAAFEAGQRDFGENYAQEWQQKHSALAALDGLRWHFIGALQSNKAKVVVPGVSLVHTVDRVSVAEALSKRALAAGVLVDVLVEVNVGGEASKAGIAPRDADVLCAALAPFEGVRLRGLMCIPPPADDEHEQRAAFARLRELRDRLRADHPTLELLSMGMSGDFEAAVAEGSTHVRVGTAIFGARG